MTNIQEDTGSREYLISIVIHIVLIGLAVNIPGVSITTDFFLSFETSENTIFIQNKVFKPHMFSPF